MKRTITAILVAGGLLTLGAECATTEEPTAARPETTVAEKATPSATATTPVIEKRTVTETGMIPFTIRRVNDPALAKGTTKVRIRGIAGVKTLTYEVTLTDGAQTRRKLIRTVVTRPPVTRVIAVGTKQRPTRECDPNYSDGCVPIASDVDCPGGSGNGPAYAPGVVRVVGSDIYDLDRDGDGFGCDS